MASRRHISFQWKVFVPMVVAMWAVIIGTLFWQMDRVRSVRDEMMFEQLSMIGARMVDLYDEQQDTAAVERFAGFAASYFRGDEHYDPLNIMIMDMNDDTTPLKQIGSTINPGFQIPKDKQGAMMIPAEQLNTVFDQDTRFLYSMHAAPFSDKKILLVLCYTKQMQDMINARFTNFWLVFVAIGILATLMAYVTTSYFGKSLKLLRNFAYQASNDPNFILTDDVVFPHNELGDITKEIIKIYTQRTIESERREQEHRIAQNALEEKERLKRDLTGNINHELKTPVGVIKGIVDTIMANPNMPEEKRKKFMVDLHNNVERLTNLITDITAITKLEAGGKYTNVTCINLHDFAFNFAEYVEASGMLQDKMTFTYDIPLNCKVVGNESLLQTVLTNFVKNSVAYSEGTMCRLIYTREDEDFYYFSYYDNGIGVPAEHLPRMFERFYRVNAGRSRNLGGTGLGLPIVEATIKAFGGQIEVLNHFPTGLEFDFSLRKYKKEEPGEVTDESLPG